MESKIKEQDNQKMMQSAPRCITARVQISEFKKCMLYYIGEGTIQDVEWG